jgi:uncharacterized protein
MSQTTAIDRLYGKVVITSPVLIALINSKPVQRLKKVTQYGVPDAYNAQFIRNFSRYEHSVGTMILLKHLGATEEEQIAGLLHDASHTAFSHVIDYVVGRTKKEDYQDSMHKDIIANSEIPEIVKTYGYDATRIADYKHFTLLERSVPDLCADRADYALREFPAMAVKTCLATMTAKDGKIVFTDRHAANVFALNYLETQENLWSRNESAIRYMFFTKILKTAMRKRIITFEDFWTDDETVLTKLHASEDKTINKLFQIMQEYKQLSYLPKSDNVLHKKFRYVDPEILSNKKLVRLSDIDFDFKKEINRAKEENEKGVPVPLLLTD